MRSVEFVNQDPMRRNIIILIVTFVLFAAVLVWYKQETRFYSIEDNENAIETAIETHVRTEIDLHKILDVDNKKYFMYTLRSGTVGSGELTKGMNGKYKFEYAGHGTGWMRERVVKTGQGYYLMLAGRNLAKIGLIEAYIEDERYSVNIPDGDYYLVLTPIQETTSDFTSGKIVYDKAGTEIERINVPTNAKE